MGAKKSTLPKVTRSSEGLRDCLFDEIDMLRNGSSTPDRAGAVAKLALNIINAAYLEIEYGRAATAAGHAAIASAVTPVRLGRSA